LVSAKPCKNSFLSFVAASSSTECGPNMTLTPILGASMIFQDNTLAGSIDLFCSTLYFNSLAGITNALSWVQISILASSATYTLTLFQLENSWDGKD
jgi:hypothetical protein